MTGRPVLLALLLAATGGGARAQDPEPWGAVQARINGAIDRGVDAMLAQQELDGSWRSHLDPYRNGQTALSIYALLKCGVRNDHQSIRRALEFLRARPPRRTYSMSCQILALCALKDEQVMPWVEELVGALIAWQRSDGGWGYPSGAVDLSNTQYAALALRTAANSGVRISPVVWEKLASRTLKHQEEVRGAYDPAGFGYHPGREATGSMTAAGTGVLAICAEQLPRKDNAVIVGLRRGIAWLGRYFLADRNPQPTHEPPHTGAHIYYYLYGVERVGGILDQDRFGEHDWYREGTRFITSKQDGNGRWGGQPDTCFALLFLARATSAVSGAGATRGAKLYGSDEPKADVSLRASGDTPLTLWISSFGTKAQAWYEWEGEEDQGLRVQRVEYRLRTGERDEDTVLLAAVEADDQQPSGRERYPVQYSFDRPGTYRVFARVKVLLPDAEPTDIDPWFDLESAELVIPVREAFDPELLEYARDPGRNLLGSAEVEISVSSERSPGLGLKSIDGLQATSWLTADGDAEPTLALSMMRPIRTDTILLSHPTNPIDPPKERPTRAQRVELKINGKKPAIAVEMVPDPMRKTIVTLARTTNVRHLEVRIVEVDPGAGKQQGVGFGELEMQYRRGRKSR